MHSNIIKFPAIAQACGDCAWSNCCANRGAYKKNSSNSDKGRTAATRRHANLFLQGDPTEALYFLRSGSVKSTVTARDGAAQIVGFHFPGDVLGVDGVASGQHQSTAIALETAGVCRIPIVKLKNESIVDPNLWDDLVRSIALEVTEKQSYALLLGQKSVHVRFAMFLCGLSVKYTRRGCSGSEFHLSMSRQDIANYLSMAVETLSRLISDFQNRELITVNRRLVQITNVEGIHGVAREEINPNVSYG